MDVLFEVDMNNTTTKNKIKINIDPRKQHTFYKIWLVYMQSKNQIIGYGLTKSLLHSSGLGAGSRVNAIL